MAWLKSYLKGVLGVPANPAVSSDPFDDYNALTLARVDLTGKTADVSATALWTDQGEGSQAYFVSGYTVCTIKGSASSELPAIVLAYTDAESNAAQTVTLGTESAANAVGTIVQGGAIINVKAGTAVTFTTATYASTNAGMTFGCHVFLERL
jgi:hypothetical protein